MRKIVENGECSLSESVLFTKQFGLGTCILR